MICIHVYYIYQLVYNMGSLFFLEFIPPQFWEFIPRLLFRGLQREGRKEGRKEARKAGRKEGRKEGCSFKKKMIKIVKTHVFF